MPTLSRRPGTLTSHQACTRSREPWLDLLGSPEPPRAVRPARSPQSASWIPDGGGRGEAKVYAGHVVVILRHADRPCTRPGSTRSPDDRKIVWRQGQPASVEHDGVGPTRFLDPKRDGHIDGTGRRRGGRG